MISEIQPGQTFSRHPDAHPVSAILLITLLRHENFEDRLS